jgi:hypothetical protein
MVNLNNTSWLHDKETGGRCSGKRAALEGAHSVVGLITDAGIFESRLEKKGSRQKPGSSAVVVISDGELSADPEDKSKLSGAQRVRQDIDHDIGSQIAPGVESMSNKTRFCN